MKYCLLLLAILSFWVSAKGQVIKASDTTTFCAGGSVSLTVNPTTGITGYQWIKNGSDLPGETNPGYAANTTGIYTVRLKRSPLTDTTIGPMVVTVNPNPNITVNSPSICVGQTATLTAAGANTYSWSPSTQLDQTTGSVVKSTATTTTKYVVTGKNSFGCSGTDTSTVTVVPLPPAPTFTFSTNGQCANLPFDFSITSPTAGVTYTWDFGDGSTKETGATISHIFNAIGNQSQTYSVKVTATVPPGCSTSSAAQPVTVKQKPDPKLFDPNNFRFCGNIGTATLNVTDASTPTPNTNYEINWGDGTANFLSGTPPSSIPHTYATGIYSVTYTVTGTNGCIGTKIFNVLNITNPRVGAGIPANASGCGPLTICFPINETKDNHSSTIYKIIFGDGSPVLTFTQPPPDSVCHTYTKTSCGDPGNKFGFQILAINGCDTSYGNFSPIRVFTKPIASFTVDPIPACVNSVVNFTNTTQYGYNNSCSTSATYKWDFGDGSPVITVFDNAAQTHVYNAAGTYQVKLIAQNTCDTSGYTLPVCIESKPIPSFTLSDSSGCIPFNVNVNNSTVIVSSCQNPTYRWTVAYTPSFCGTSASFTYMNGTNETSANPSFSFANPGTYTITQNVTNACGTFTSSKTVTVRDKLTATITAPLSTCINQTVFPQPAFNCYSGPATYSWSFPGGSPSSSTDSLPGAITYSVPGTYTISLSVKNDCGTTTATKSIVVNTITPANAGPSQNKCGGSVTMAANTPAIGTGQWSNISGPSGFRITSPSSPTTTITSLVPGTYVFRWTITNQTCTSSSDVTIIISSGPTEAVTGPDQELCLKTSTTLPANVAVTGTGQWSQVSGPNNATFTTPTSENTASVTGLIPGVYVFRWTISFSNCTPSTDDIQVTVYNNPSIANAGADQTICADATTFTASNPAIGTGTWSQLSGPNTANIANINSSSSRVSGLIHGTYTFKWTITSGPCQSTQDTMTINVTEVATTANAGPDIRACAVSTVSLSGNAASVGTGLWTMVSGNAGAIITDPSLFNTSVSGLSPGTYIFKWTITNGNCPASSDEVTVIIDENVTVANAGPTQTKCGNVITMSANAPSVGSGLWTTVSGPNNPTITNPALPGTTITNLVPGDYVFNWAITNGSCSSASDVSIIISSGPSAANAGIDQDLCLDTSANLTANIPAIGTGNWSQVSGPNAIIVTPSSNVTKVNGLVPGIYVFRWTISFSNCTPTTDDVQVIIYDNPSIANAGANQTICASTTSFTATVPSIGTGTWSQLSGPNTAIIANGSSATSAVSGLVPGNYAFKWTITNGPCISTQDTVRVEVSAIASPANAGVDQTICASPSAVLTGNTPQTGTGAWSFVSGPTTPLIADSSKATTSVNGLTTGSYIFRWTITNGVCPPNTDDVEIKILDSLRNIISTTIDTICAGQPITITGDDPSGGTGVYSYNWQQSADGVNWSDIPSATEKNYSAVLTSSLYFRRNVTSLPCEKASNIIFINVQPGISNNIITEPPAICANTRPAAVVGSTPSGGDGIYTFSWQQSTDGGVTWNTIAGQNGVNYNPDVLTQTTQYRRGVSTSLCSGPQSNFSNVIIITVHPDAKAFFTANTTTACTPFKLGDVITVTPFADRNLLYAWYANDTLIGSNSNGTFPNYTLNNPGDTVIIRLRTTSLFGCKEDNIEQQFITVTTVFAKFTKDTSFGCGPLSVKFVNTSSILNNTQFFWDFGNGVTSNEIQPDAIVFNSSPYFNDTTYQISLRAYNGCDTTKWTDSVKVRANPKARFGVDTTFGCSPFTITIDNTSLGGPNTYYWDFGNGVKDTTNVNSIFNYTYNIGNGVDTFTIRLIAENECRRDTQSIDIRIAPNPIRPLINVNSTDLFGCTPHTVSFNNNTSGATSYRWNFGDGTPVVITNNGQSVVQHTFNTAGVFNVSIEITNGCSDTTVFRKVTVYSRPVAAFTTNAFVCAGDTIKVINSSKNATNYNWFWDDGTTNTDSLPTHIYNVSGNYNIVLRAEVTDTTGLVCVDTIVRPVTVLAKPVVNVQSNINAINCAPFTLNVSAPGITDETVTWYIYDSTVTPSIIMSGGTSAQYTYNKPGSFYVKMLARNARGCSDSTIISFTVRGKAVASFTPGSLAVCTRDTTISYRNTSSYNGTDLLSYQWLVDGILQSTNANFVHRYSVLPAAILPQAFNTTLIVSNTVGCSDTTGATLQMNPLARALFSIANPGDCVPFIPVIDNSSTYATSYRWLLNGNLVSDSARPVITITEPSTLYTLTLVADNVYGCKPDSFSVKFTSRAKPAAAFTVSDTLGCTGSLNILTNNQTTGPNLNTYTYIWHWGDGTPDIFFKNSSHQFTAPGQYLIQLVANDGFCRDTTSQVVRVSIRPTVDFSVDLTRTCDTARVNFTNLTTNGQNYQWSFGDGKTSIEKNPSHSYAPSLAPYTVKLVASSDFGCKDSAVRPNLVLSIAPPASDFMITPSPVITVPDYTFGFNNLTLNSSNYKYLWSLGDGSFAETRDVTHKYADTGSYQVRLVVLDTSTGCTDTTTKLARIGGFPGYLYVTNAFYPNSLRNEFKTFKPLGKGLAEYHLQVFDSWGKLLFETKLLDAAGIPTEGWDGTYNGKPMAQDTYAWKIKATFRGGKQWDGMVYTNMPGKTKGVTFGTVLLFR